MKITSKVTIFRETGSCLQQISMLFAKILRTFEFLIKNKNIHRVLMVRNFHFHLKKLKKKGSKQYKINLGIFEKALIKYKKKTIEFKKALIK